tara:strand:+ start:219 stop:518 length:300 start_codon:yes stop_codon:yes gene_type:complete
MPNKDKNKNTIDSIIERANTNDSGYNEGSADISSSLLKFKDAAKLAVSNAQADAIDKGTKKSNDDNITKPSRNGKSRTLIGLARLQGFMGSRKPKQDLT